MVRGRCTFAIPMRDFPERQSPRLGGYDYARATTYFVTVCTAHRDPILSRIADGVVVLLPAGESVARTWTVVLARTPAAQLLADVVMPDHIHALVSLGADGWPSGSLCALVRAVKAHSAFAINRQRRSRTPVWQRSYHDHIIRDDIDLAAHYRYIAENPRRWSLRLL
jgi:putative transposase